MSEAVLAKKMGYDAVLLSPGGLGHLTEEELLERTKAVAEIMPVIGFIFKQQWGQAVYIQVLGKHLQDSQCSSHKVCFL